MLGLNADSMHWREVPIHIIDFEGSRRSGILEFGVVTLFGGRIDSVRTRLCAPVGEVDEREVAIHGIGAAEASDYPPFSEEWGYFTGLRKRGPFGAHFAGAENHLIKSVWPYPPVSPDFVWPGRRIAEWGPWIDTGRLYGEFFPEAGSAGLGALVGEFGFQEELDRLAAEHCPEERRCYHAALYDAMAAAVLLLGLMERPEFGGLTVAGLLEKSAGSGEERRRAVQRELF